MSLCIHHWNENVCQRFDRMMAGKMIAFIDENGYLAAIPNLGVVSAASNALLVNRAEERKREQELKDGQRTAVLLVTLESQVHQAKGTYHLIDKNTAYIQLYRVYSCSLPRPGERVDIPPLRRVELPDLE